MKLPGDGEPAGDDILDLLPTGSKDVAPCLAELSSISEEASHCRYPLGDCEEAPPPRRSDSDSELTGAYRIDSALLNSLPADLAEDLGAFRAAALPTTASSGGSRRDGSGGASAPAAASFGESAGGATCALPPVDPAAAAPDANVPPSMAQVGCSPAGKGGELERWASLEHQLAEVLGTLAVTHHPQQPPCHRRSGSSGSSGRLGGGGSCEERAPQRFSSPGAAPPHQQMIVEQGSSGPGAEREEEDDLATAVGRLLESGAAAAAAVVSQPGKPKPSDRAGAQRPAPGATRGASVAGAGADEADNPGALMYLRQRDWRQRNEQRYAEMRQQEEAAALEGCTFSPRINPRSRQLQHGGVRYPDRPLTSFPASPAPANSTHQALSPAKRSVSPSGPSSAHAAPSSPARPASARPAPRPATGLSGTQACLAQLQYSGQLAGQVAAALGIPVGYPAAEEQLRGQELAGVAHLYRAGSGSRPRRPASAGARAPAASPAVQGPGQGQLYRAVSFGSNWGDVTEVGGESAVAGVVIEHGLGDAAAAGGGGGGAGGAGERPWSPMRRASSASTARIISPCPGSASERAGLRLYAHAVDKQRRQKEAVKREHLREFKETYGSGPKAQPLPAFYQVQGAYVPLTERPRSPPARSPSPKGEAALFCPRSTTHRACNSEAYWRKHNLPAGTSFEDFMERQEKCAKLRQEGLELERAAASHHAKPALAPGTRRILERKERAPAQGEAGEGEKAGSKEGGGARGIVGALCSVLQRAGRPGAGETSANSGQPATAAAAAESGATFKPQITKKAEAKPAKSPEELHAGWAIQQDRLEQKQRAAEAAQLRECSFQPALSPPLDPKYASVPPKISPKGLAKYLAAEQEKLREREEGQIKAQRAKQEKELAACTFKPAVTKYKFDLRRPIPAALRAASAQAAAPAAPVAPATSPPVEEQRGPFPAAKISQLAQAADGQADDPGLGALRHSQPAVPDPAPAASLAGGYTAKALADAARAAAAAAGASGAAGEAQRAPISFDTYLDRVVYELQQMQTADGTPAVWLAGGAGAERDGLPPASLLRAGSGER